MKKLIAIQNELKAPKSKFNSFGKYNYRSCEDILEAVKPLCEKHDCVLTISDELEQIGERYYIKATARLKTPDEVFVVSGYAREADVKKGMDESQITGTASSYARKYALNGLFCIDDTKDADDDEYKKEADARQKKDDAEKKKLISEINDICADKNMSIDEVCKKAKVKSLDDLNVARLQNCITWLNS